MFVVTGAGRGIGRALALELASRGQSVLILGRKESSLIEVAKQADSIQYMVADISMTEDRKRIADFLKNKQLKGLIHNAGIIDPITSLAKITETQWQQLMRINVEGPLFLSQLLLRQLSQGRVLHIGSGAAYFPIVGWSAYCTSKAALSMLTRCWQLEYADPAFASVMPGIIDTDMMTTIRHAASMDPEKLNFFQELKNNDQLLKVETVAKFLSWLLLDVEKSEYVAKEWDIYDTTHHYCWLPKDHVVPSVV